MQWFLLALIVVALLFMSTRYPRAAFAVLGGLLVAGAVVYLLSEQWQEKAGAKIRPEEIRLEDTSMVPAYADSFTFSARLINTSPDAGLGEVLIGITMLDCPDAQSDQCLPLGGTEERVVVKIPPGQARDVTRNVYFQAARPKGVVKWRYQVLQTRS